MSESPRAKELAEAILIVIKTVSKWILLFVVGIVVLGSLFFGGAVILDNFEKKERQRDLASVSAIVVDEFEQSSVTPKQENKDKNQETEASYETDEILTCVPWKPFKVTLKNNSQKTITEVRFDLLIRQKGRSKVVNDTFRTLTSDFILKPGDSVTECWGATFELFAMNNRNNKQPKGPYDVEIEVTGVTFDE